MSKEMKSLTLPFCLWCDNPKVEKCQGNCPEYKKYRKWFGNRRYRNLLKTKLRKCINEDT